MEVIRILHVLGGLNQGGVENLLINIYRTIDRKKVQFDFLVNRPGYFDEEVKKMGGKIYYIPSLQSVGEIQYRKNLNHFFQEHNGEYNIIHSHLNQVSGLILELAYKNNIPIRIAHSHNNAYSIRFVARLYKEFLRKKIDKYATYLFACSNEAADFMFHKNSKNAMIIKNGIPIDKFLFEQKKRRKFRVKYDISDDAIVVGHIGRFEKQKNHKFLIQIFDEYHKQNLNSYLVMVGTGTLKTEIESLCKNYSWYDHVICLEPTSSVDEIYCGMDTFVFPSLYEGLGMVLVEAQTCGLPCIASADVIPREAQITKKFTFIDLNEKPAIWASHIINKPEEKRNKVEYLGHKNPYDIREIAILLQNFYLEHNEKGE